MKSKLIRAELKDLETILGLMQEFYEIEHLNFDPHFARKSLKELLSFESFGMTHIIYACNEISGYVVTTNCYSLEFHGRFALIDELYLRQDYRGRGIARSALEELEEICRKNGIHAVRLEVARTNIHARNVYLKAGFKAEERDLMTKWIKE
ncbi:MAG: GNAT family N-acetyltransferase [Ignavibacteria bacterium]|jgi:ribosomal protein S18 acetylase RimI-like enzyme|nr:GNAT family N-acetyltransferase [Ignavibacteria bacterium]MCU7504294.1 GNAT family N-acetyltransferase [Ignavibacteria bacterium]MCU7516139.1 GNAT family N-acetyltransferase [Ignavibacteria bacterium]